MQRIMTNFSGMLSCGEIINGYSVVGMMDNSSSEAEIYLVSKDNCNYVLKYYYNCKPNKQVVEKVKNIKNPYILSLYDYGQYNNRFFEIIEYAEGGALDSKTADGKYEYLPFTEEQAVKFVKQAISGFQEMHKVGILHRDIKTSNFLIKAPGSTDIKIGDFGISRYFDVEFGDTRLTTNTNEHTEGYSAPEAYSYLIGPELDYYSLGVTLWEVLTAKDPCVDLSGKPMTVEQIILNTIDGKMPAILLQRSPELSVKMRTLIAGLLTKRHDKRWNYDLVTRFLNGEAIPVYEEPTEIGTFKIGKVECHTYKEIAIQLLKNKTAVRDYVYKYQLNRELAKVNNDLANKVADIVDLYSAEGKYDEGIAAVAYTLCSNLGFNLNAKITVESLDDIKNVLVKRPDIILPYLKDYSLGFYDYLDSLNSYSLSKLIKKIVEESDSDFLIPAKINLALNGNKIRPFKDEKYSSVVLSSLNDLEKLTILQKYRFLMLINAGDRQLQAWLENVSGKRISDWKEFIGFYYEGDTKNRTESLWDYFAIFFLPQSNLSSGNFLNTIKELKKSDNYAVMNKIIDILSKNVEVQSDNQFIIECYSLLRKNHLEGLSYSFDHYMGMLGKAYYNTGNFLDAEDYFELTLKLNSSYTRSADFLNCSYDTNMKNQNFAEAQKTAENLIKLFPDSCMSYFKMAEAIYLQNKFEEAIPYYTFAIEHEEHREFYRRRCDCYKRTAPYVKGVIIPEYQTKIEFDEKKYMHLKN